MTDQNQNVIVSNPFASPKIRKIVVNMGVRGALEDKKILDKTSEVLARITGQKPKVTKAKKSIASFKLREGDAIGLVVTMRGKRMTEFFQKLVRIVLPRLRDFHGVRRNSFDGHGNYTLGFTEYSVFPEIDPGSVDRLQGLEVIIVTSGRNDREGLLLLESLGMPFQKSEKLKVKS